MMRKTRSNKFNASTTTVDGIKFASKLEAKRYEQLKLLQYAGEIKHLELQPVFPLEIEGRNIGRYTADFKYWDANQKRFIIEDCKGKLTEAASLRIRVAQAVYRMKVNIIRKEDVNGR